MNPNNSVMALNLVTGGGGEAMSIFRKIRGKYLDYIYIETICWISVFENFRI